MESKFFTFIKPYISYIDNGEIYRRPFSWVYMILAVLNLILPIYIFVKAVDTGVFDGPAKFVIVFILIWLIMAFAGWISFQLWWDRRTKILGTSQKDDDFVATPVFSHFIQTFGEWFGTWIGIVGFGFALISTIFLGESGGSVLSNRIGVGILESGILAIILMPIYGFLIIVVTRFLAEQFRALSSIANNTKK